jgi:hypothetical protein
MRGMTYLGSIPMTPKEHHFNGFISSSSRVNAMALIFLSKGKVISPAWMMSRD